MKTFVSKCCHAHIEYSCLEVKCLSCGNVCTVVWIERFIWASPVPQNNHDLIIDDIQAFDFQVGPIPDHVREDANFANRKKRPEIEKKYPRRLLGQKVTCKKCLINLTINEDGICRECKIDKELNL